MHFSAIKSRTVKLAALLLMMLGQLSVAAHAFDHGIADQPETCATCVHFDQGAATATKIASPITFDSSPDRVTTCTATVSFADPAGSFDARAPPL